MKDRTSKGRWNIKLAVSLTLRLAPLVLLLNILSGCLYLNSEPRSQEVTGRVLDAQTHLPIKGVAVYLLSAPHHTTYSDATGHFRLKKARNQHVLTLPPEGWWPENKDALAGMSHPDYDRHDFDAGYGEGSVDLGDIFLNPRTRITIGMGRAYVVAEIGKLSGREITPKVRFTNNEAGNVTTRSFYQFVNFDVVLMLECKDEIVVQMIYWTKKDFGGDKRQQDKTAQRVESLKFDNAMHVVSFEKAK
jgi:hypothetical protein